MARMCDCCAGEVDGRPVYGSVWGEPVQVCGGACVARLVEVWQPAPRRLVPRGSIGKALVVVVAIIVTLSQVVGW